MDYVYNAWYAVGFANEVQREALMRRTVLDRPLVTFRGPDGMPAVLDDRCSHRHAPLSKGRLVDGLVECPYHGLRFDGAGKCRLVPSQTSIPPEADIRAYPVIERHGLVWAWMGAPAAADPDEVPDLHWVDDPDWRFQCETLNFPGNYLLVVDNLMDLVHTAFVHPTTLRISELPDKPIKVARVDHGVTLSRWVLDCPPPPMFAGLMAGQRIDRAQITNFWAPSTIRHLVLTAPAGVAKPEADDYGGMFQFRTLVAITPETVDSSHYFRMSGHNFLTDDPTITDFLFRTGHVAMEEDQWIIGAQRDNIAEHAAKPRNWVDFNQDGATLQARRIVDAMIADEGGGRDTASREARRPDGVRLRATAR